MPLVIVLLLCWYGPSLAAMPGLTETGVLSPPSSGPYAYNSFTPTNSTFLPLAVVGRRDARVGARHRDGDEDA
jgi:hypothetical protein